SLAANAGGVDNPFINWMLGVSRADSGMYYLGPSGSATQAGRATRSFVGPKKRAIQFKNTTFGSYQYVGYHWFEHFDKRSESGAWGWVGRRWNPYDGRDYASAHKLPDSLPGVGGAVYPTLAEDGPAYAATDPGLPYKVYGDFITPSKNWNISIPTILAPQFSGAAPTPDTTPPTQPGTLTADIRYTPPPPTQPGSRRAATGPTPPRLAGAAATDNIGVTSYRVSRKPTASGAFAQVGTTSQLVFQDAGLAPSTGYDYSVVALDAAGNVSPARVGSFTTIAQVLTRVTENFDGPDNPTSPAVPPVRANLSPRA